MLMAKTWKIKDIEPQRNNKNKDFLYFKLTHPQSAFRLDVHYGQYGLVENCVAYIFTRLCVRCNLQVQMAKIYPNNTFGVEKKKRRIPFIPYLCKNVIHCFTGVIITLA